MRNLVLFLILIPVLLFAEELPLEKNQELAEVLSNLTEFRDPIYFVESGYAVKFFAVKSNYQCSVKKYCRTLLEPLILISEIEVEGPIHSLYRLPKKHNWEVISNNSLPNGWHEFHLEATTYDSDKPQAKENVTKFTLKTNWFKVELIAL